MKSARAVLLVFGLIQAVAAAEPELNEVIVNGERLARSRLETASSLSVVSRAELAQPGADRLDQVMALMPNVQLGSGSEGPAIRGQDSTGVLRDLPGFLGGARPRATLQVDGRAVTFNEFIFGTAPLWDVRQVEVYRSPQTTTQGRNSIAGAIFIDTVDPVYQWEGSARLLVGNQETRQGSFALAGPLVEDQLGVRVAGDLRRGRTSSELGDSFADVDPNRDEYALLRAKLLAEPDAFPGLRLLTTYVHSDSQQPQLEGVVAPFEERRDPRPGYGVFSTLVNSLTTVAAYPLADSLDATTTLSWGDVHVVRHALPGLGESDTNSQDLSLESMVNWRATSSLRMFGGLYLLRTDLDQDINLASVLGTGSFNDRQESLGLFGEAQWRASRRFSLTAGLRYEREDQRRNGAIAGPAILLPIEYDAAFEAWLPKLSLSYDLGKDARIGLLVLRAYNPGGIALNFDTGKQEDFDAERLWNYELFLRLGLAEGRGSLSANVFYSVFEDAQRAQPRAFTVPGGATAFWSEIVNVPATRSRGIETELTWRLGAHWQLRSALGILDTRIVRTSDPKDPLLGNEFARAPSHTAALGLTWQLPVWRISAQVRRNAGYFSNDANTPALRIDSTTVVDVSATYDRKHWSVFAYARNLLDEFYLTTLTSPLRGTAGDPRKVGLGVEVRF